MSASQELNMEALFDAPVVNDAFDELQEEEYLDEIDVDLDGRTDDEELSEDEDADNPTYNIKHSRSTAKSSLTPSAAETAAAPIQGPHAFADQEALFRDLMRDHQKRLYRFVIRYIDHPDDAADITQQAFAEASRTISSFRGDSKLSTWLYGIAMNMVRNYLSRAPHRVYRFESDEILGGLACAEPDPSDSLEQRELLELVECAFAGLPPEMSKVLSLVAIDEISYQDAADLLSIPLGTVRSRVSRARAVLRTYFQHAGVTLSF